MFLFETLHWYNVVMFFVVLAVLMGVNELARINKWVALLLFVVLPIFLTFFVWPNTAVEGSSVGTWFHYVKVYSVLAVVLVLMGIRYIKGWSSRKYILIIPAILLALNILEAVIRDFQCYSFVPGIHDGTFIVGGPWNIMNAIAGILNIIAISGWAGIMVSKGKKKDFIWPDQIWIWIIPYDLWNFAYVYNCIPDHAFFAGAVLLLSCTIPACFIKKGAWLQHRAHTLAIWVMFAMTFPAFQDTSMFAVKSSHNTTTLFVVSLLALLSNVALVTYHIYRIVKLKRNPMKDDIYKELKAYQLVLEDK